MTSHHRRTLLIVHVATREGTMPDGTPWGYELEEYDDFAIGTGDKLGRIFHALYLAQAAKEPRLYITLPPDELSQLGEEGFKHLVDRALVRLRLHADTLTQNFGFDMEEAFELLDSAYIDDWSDAKAFSDPMNTAGEAARASRYAQTYSYGIVQPVSTGCGHSPRCGATDFAQAEKDGLTVAGYASVPFPGMAGQQATIIDPPHLKDASFAQTSEARQMHKVIGTVFAVGLDPSKSKDEQITLFNEFMDVSAEWIISKGRTTNIKGELL